MQTTIPLELARRIHEKALEKGIELMESEYIYLFMGYGYVKMRYAPGESNHIIKAYTTDELLEILPHKTYSNGEDRIFFLRKDDEVYTVGYYLDGKSRDWVHQNKILNISLGELLCDLIKRNRL